MQHSWTLPMNGSDTRALSPCTDESGRQAAASTCATSAFESLNTVCFCISLDDAALAQVLETELDELGVGTHFRKRYPHLFSGRPVFIAAAQLQRMAHIIRAVEQVVALPAYREQVLADAPPVARHVSHAKGVFFGYDFHLNRDALGLIEINTNAGGALLNSLLARAQRTCCAPLEQLAPTPDAVTAFEQAILAMFQNEWQLAGRNQPLACVAIVDDDPPQQYLYREFLLFRRLFERSGLRVVISDPAALALRDGALWHGDTAIDLVYNRLTDFYLQADRCAALHEAYLRDAVVLTPYPQAYALYADKRRLAALSDPAFLQSIDVPANVQQILLESVPRTELVQAADADRLWAKRKELFFKPVSGFGSRATYRGDKLTKRVWQDILAADYVAQALVAPGERLVRDHGTVQAMKFDLRNYVYDGTVQWVAARVYQGQTTNFRTPGGGFAPVFSASIPPTPSESPVQRDAYPEAGGPSTERQGHCGYASYVFLLDEAGEVHPLPHALYVALVRAEGATASLAGKTLRLADWYVRLTDDGRPDAVINETYIEVRFDERGCVDWSASPAGSGSTQPPTSSAQPQASPTQAERSRMRLVLFGSAHVGELGP